MRNYQLSLGIYGTAASKFIGSPAAAQGDNRATFRAMAIDAINAAEEFEAEFHSRPSLPPHDLTDTDVPL